VPIFELRVFVRKTRCCFFYLPAVLGVNGLRPRTDAVLNNNDVCIKNVRPVHGFNTNSQLTSIQGRMLVNGWHMIGELKATPKTAVF